MSSQYGRLSICLDIQSISMKLSNCLTTWSLFCVYFWQYLYHQMLIRSAHVHWIAVCFVFMSNPSHYTVSIQSECLPNVWRISDYPLCFARTWERAPILTYIVGEKQSIQTWIWSYLHEYKSHRDESNNARFASRRGIFWSLVCRDLLSISGDIGLIRCSAAAGTSGRTEKWFWGNSSVNTFFKQVY